MKLGAEISLDTLLSVYKGAQYINSVSLGPIFNYNPTVPEVHSCNYFDSPRFPRTEFPGIPDKHYSLQDEG